jgi:hypothetical protein
MFVIACWLANKSDVTMEPSTHQENAHMNGEMSKYKGIKTKRDYFNYPSAILIIQVQQR